MRTKSYADPNFALLTVAIFQYSELKFIAGCKASKGAYEKAKYLHRPTTRGRHYSLADSVRITTLTLHAKFRSSCQ
jgi:hypothetical protein